VIEQVIERIWPLGVDSVEPLGGGMTNHNFKVQVGGQSFVLRVGGENTELLGIDRSVEHDASLAAAALGIAPEVIAFIGPEGYLVTRFVAGESCRVSAPEAARLLRRFHAGRAISGRFDAFAVIEAYAATAHAAGIVHPPGYAAARRTADRIARRRGPFEACPCHNDLLAANFIHGDGRLWVVDWEYAGMGDPAFDLANFAVNNGLDEAGDDELLAAYGGGHPDVHVLMRYVSDLREAMWGLVQQAIAKIEFDFARYADDHFARLEQIAAEPRFGRALR